MGAYDAEGTLPDAVEGATPALALSESDENEER